MSSPRRLKRAAGVRSRRATVAGEDNRPPLTLASRSPQRAAILSQLGVAFHAVAGDVEELAHGAPERLAVENARRKAGAVEGSLVLGVDTIVAVDGRPYGKPRDRDEAAAVLGLLSGREHEVWSGIALRSGRATEVSSARTAVRFRRLSAAEVRWYLDGEEWRGRAGGYAIQGRGASLVEAIEGDFWNVVGLPVAELMRLAPELVVGGGQSDHRRATPRSASRSRSSSSAV
jgi:septum formation protein